MLTAGVSKQHIKTVFKETQGSIAIFRRQNDNPWPLNALKITWKKCHSFVVFCSMALYNKRWPRVLKWTPVELFTTEHHVGIWADVHSTFVRRNSAFAEAKNAQNRDPARCWMIHTIKVNAVQGCMLFAYGHGALLATWSQYKNVYIRSREVNTEKMSHTSLDMKTRSLKWYVYYWEGNNQKLSQHMGRFYPIQRGSSSEFVRQNESPAKV